MVAPIIKTNLKIISADEGSVLHFIKSSDRGFANFGEVYFSTVKKDCIKAWKLHTKMTLNLVVPVGKVLFNFIDAREDSDDFEKLHTIVLSQDPYFRLTVPPMFWFGFKGLSEGLNLISNQADVEHEPQEVKRKPIDGFNVDWNTGL